MANQKINVSIVGATGYTGAELVRLILGHPNLSLKHIVGQSKAGLVVSDVLPQFSGMVSGKIESFDANAICKDSDAVFCALPHKASAPIVKELRAQGVIVFDLSADFRLKDPEVYKTWYTEPQALEIWNEAVYGLVELHRKEIKTADLIAVPGCYPTAATLSLAPLLKENLIDTHGIIVDAKSGVSGAGRGLSQTVHFAESAEGLRAYKVGAKHRHTPEIEQELSAVANQDIQITFTPHLVPMIRGILSTAYAKLSHKKTTAEDCVASAKKLYADSPFVVVLEDGKQPDTNWVKGSNRVFLSYTADERTNTIIATAAIDNLIKGAAGQAIQCLNIRYGFNEDTALTTTALWP